MIQSMLEILQEIILTNHSVGPRILQRYLKPILASALSNTANTSLPAIDVLGYVVKQGLTHPIDVCLLMNLK